MTAAKKHFFLAAAAADLPALALASPPPFHGASPSAFSPTPSSVLGSKFRIGRRRRRFVADSNGDVAWRTASSSSPATPPGKGDLYDDVELSDLLNLHRALNPEEGVGSFGAYADGDADDVELNEESIAMGGIHDWVLQTLDEGDADETIDSTDGTGQGGGDLAGASAMPGLHELVLETIDDIDASSSSSSSPFKNCNSPSVNDLAYGNLQTLLRDKKPSIRAIATDVDGTLLSGRYLHPTTRDAVLKAIDQAYGRDGKINSGDEGSASGTPPTKIRHFFPATGKSRRGAEISLGPVVGPLLRRCPGVYIQGLYCVDGEGNVVFERRLSRSAVRAAEALVEEFGISVVGYDGDNLYTTERTDVVKSLSEVYGEPTVELIANAKGDTSAMKLVEHAPGLHKLLLMDEDLDALAAVRPRLEELASANGATITQAIPTMLEMLPGGCSKGHGVRRLCEALGVDVSGELLALGDAENDAGMLEDAAIGVAMGNASCPARDAADFIMRENHEEGGAGLAMELFGFDA